MEDISKGERIRKYKIEGKLNRAWKLFAEGESVGHKRIQEFEAAKVSSLRLRVPGSIASPGIRKFAVYNIC